VLSSQLSKTFALKLRPIQMGPAFQATQIYEAQPIQMKSVMQLSISTTSSKICLLSQPLLLNTCFKFLFFFLLKSSQALHASQSQLM